ncbi:outer membrane protein [Terriglobus roseus DSM 18391]|uniref:Outer membrane protein n=1 Tax=Terriglobus roseus (strain DSM 18391 / NRRL B-41598 / KBS 63) TaxID=926566 RepID=I3ZFH2_TERRK|nr:TolC family protein [Terriglobus roseus]AFL87990.1 outer membrane protein [Terriglobus roseus DSM 18391]
MKPVIPTRIAISAIIALARTACVSSLAVSIIATAQQRPPASQSPQPPPYTAPQPALSPVPASSGLAATESQQPSATPDAPLPQPDGSTIDLRDVKPLSVQPVQSAQLSATQQRAQSTVTKPQAETPSSLRTGLFNVVGAYHPARVAALPAGDTSRLSSLVRDGKLYLSLHDALALAIENNLDVEVGRYSLGLAETDITRAKGGGTLRGLDYTVTQTAPGVGAATTPFLITTTTQNGSPTNASITDLSQVTQTGSTTQQSLSESGTDTYAQGPPIPIFDPTLIGELGYLRRSNQTSLIETATTGSTSNTGPLSFLSGGLDYQQGFSPGTQIEAFVDNAPSVLYGPQSQYNPFKSPSTSVTVTQPLLRGRGRAVNLRFVRIAQINQKVSRLLFEQQVLETVYGVSRLYYDLVSLGENIGVKEQSLAAAQRLLQDDRNQVSEGTLAPVELTRAQALVSSSRLDLIQARGQYRQQEVILRQQLVRNMADPGVQVMSIVATDRITVPDAAPQLDVSALTADALANRPDLAQAGLQVAANEVSARGTGNAVKPLLNLYANVQARGSSLVPYQNLGSAGTGVVQVPTALTTGGLRLSTIYQAGIQLNLPLRNRIAQADAARDQIQLRRAQGRTAKLENDIRQQIENASVALENAHEAYTAAVESRDYQQQLLTAEIDKFAVGASTNFMIIQDQAYLAQARSTEVAARSNWMKAQMALDRALGDLLSKNRIELDDAIRADIK